MAVDVGSWSEQARGRGRTLAIWRMSGGCALLVVVSGLLLADGSPTWLRPILILALLVPLHLIMHGRRRLKIESSPPLKPPLVLPAVSDPGSFARLSDPGQPLASDCTSVPCAGPCISGSSSASR